VRGGARGISGGSARAHALAACARRAERLAARIRRGRCGVGDEGGDVGGEELVEVRLETDTISILSSLLGVIGVIRVEPSIAPPYN
jgi:hypothetical protein